MNKETTQTLRGMQVPPPRFRIAPLPEPLRHVRGFHGLQTFFPTLSKIYRLSKHQSEDVWLDSTWRIQSIDISGTSGPCRLQLVANLDTNTQQCPSEPERAERAFMKVTHLLDPIRWMRGQYSLPKHTGLPWHNRTWTTASNKLQDPWNQAYVETIATYALGRIREGGGSPHFNHFYGAFCARADTYRYNLTEDYPSMRNARWFWNGQKRGIYTLRIQNAGAPDKEVEPDILEEFLREPSVMDSEEESVESDGSASEEEVEVAEGAAAEASELESLHSDDMESVELEEASESGSGSGSSSGSSLEDDSPIDDYRIYAEFKDFPVMLIAVEENSGTMDALLDISEEVGATHGTPEWEARWTAWLFQVAAALSCAQAVLGFTHNDLHTNNIVWTKTDEEYLFYTRRDGTTFRVPTYGKLFRIIDFGRAIFTINGQYFISDDFRAGNDADGQYIFKPLHPRPTGEEIAPNPSFDLCRLAVSLLDAVFLDTPEAKEGAGLLSSEEGLEVPVTVSPLYNMLWKWLLDDEGRNVLIEPDGTERFPGFDLYKHIAAKVHGAVPAQQFQDPAFDAFQVPPTDIPTGSKAWSLFC